MVNFATGCKSERKTIIYKSGVTLSIVYSKDTPLETVEDFANKLNSIRGESSEILNDGSNETNYEIVIGETNRNVSQKAYSKLREINKSNNEYVSYVFYCDRSSLAIAYEDDIFKSNLSLEAALEKFLSNYAVSGSLVLNEGLLESNTINIVNEQRKLDNVKRATEWQKLKNNLSSKYGTNHAEETINSLKQLYKCFDTDVIYWMANLYDINAGFYYSNSARDSSQVVYNGKTISFGSDLESTDQVFTFLEGMGVFQEYSNKIKDGLPEEFGNKISLWVKSLQAPNGYFYHPQWESYYTRDAYGNVVNDGLPTTRRSRDLSRATSILSTFGYKPTYDTPNGVTGDGIIVTLNNTISNNNIKPLATQTPSTDINDYLDSTENFRTYLDTIIKPKILESNEKAYAQSNFLNTQIGIIKAKDLELDPTGETTPLTTTLINWLDELQDNDTGLWIKPKNKLDFNAVNGAFKIVSIYQSVKKICPNPDKVVNSCLKLLKDEDCANFLQVVYLYNIWNAMDLVIKNINWYGAEEDKNTVNDIRSKIIADSATYIIKSSEVIKLFIKEDGSSSYNQDSSSYTSQNMQVAIRYTNEGDVNATSINAQGILKCMCSVLNISKINPFGEAERMQFVLAIDRQTPIIKKN